MLAGALLAGALALAVHAAEPAAQPGADAVPPDPNAVTPAMPNVLPECAQGR